MELVNKKYVKLSRFDVFKEQITALESKDKSKQIYFQKLGQVLMDYEKDNKIHVKDIYISRDSFYVQKNLNSERAFITRNSLINALLIAMINNENDIAIKLSNFLSKTKILSTELGDLLNFILDNNIDINEYYWGEEDKIIYNDVENKIEEGHIYTNENKGKIKNLELK